MNKKTNFRELISAYSQETSEQQRKKIENQVWDLFGTTKAVLVTDMSGFTCLTKSHGTVHYLSMIDTMYTITKQIVQKNSGLIVKVNADNCVSIFDTVDNALKTSISLNAEFDELNKNQPNQPDIKISSGIDYGQFLIHEGVDIFGNPINIASKLGEDIASAKQILITTNASNSLSSTKNIKLKTLKKSVSNVQIEAFEVIY